MKEALSRCEDDIQTWMKEGDIFKQGQQTFFNSHLSEVGHLKIVPQVKRKKFDFYTPPSDSVFVEAPFKGSGMRDEIYECGYYEKGDIEEMFGIKLNDKESEDGQDKIMLKEAYKAHHYHAIWTPQTLILVEPWMFQIPYFKYTWTSLDKGYATQGIITEVKDIQYAINARIEDIDQSFMRMGRPKWLVEESSEVSANQLANLVSAVVFYKRNAPEAYTPTPINREYFLWVERLVQYAYSLTGVSELYSSGQLPLRLEGSGDALQALDAIGSDRFQIATQNYEKLFTQVAGFMCQFAQKSFKKKEYSEINFDEVSEWTSVMTAEHPSGKVQQANDLFERELIDKETYLQAIEYHNIDESISQETLAKKALEKRIKKALDDGLVWNPDENFGYPNILNMASKMKYKYILDDEDEGKIALLDKLIDKVKAYIKKNLQDDLPPPPPPAQQQPKPGEEVAPPRPQLVQPQQIAG